MKKRFRLIFLLACSLGAQTLPSGWKLHPAGTQVAVDTLPMASALSPDGKYLLVMNAGVHAPSISVIDLPGAKELSRTQVPDAWLGLVFNKAGDKVYVGGGSGAAVYEFSFANGTLSPSRMFPVIAAKDRTPQDFVGDVRFSPDYRLLYAADVHRDAVIAINPQSGLVISRIRTGRRPYRILFHPSGKTFYVSSWADGSIGQYDVNSGERLVNFRVAPHPLDMLWLDGATIEGQPQIKARMLVAAANTNSMYVLGVTESGDLSKLETVNLSITGNQPLGMTPSSLAASQDGKEIYVACSDANAIAVVEFSADRTAVKGFIPTGWYPTAVLKLPDNKLGILNGRGNSVGLVDAPDDAKLAGFTNGVIDSSLYRDNMVANPLPGGPIRHVVYVVRDGGAQPVAPNRDKLAREFVSLTNFSSLAENTAEGVNWATAAIAPDYTERLAQNNDAGRRKVYDFEGQDPANLPPAGYIWNAVAQAGLKLRNYGFQVHNRDKATPDGEQVDRVYDPALSAATDMEYRGPDAAYPDTDRAKEFAGEMKEYDGLDEMPQLLLVRIGNDDAALGTIAEAVSHSKFWKETAMFVTDARGDTIDPANNHRTIALVVSPWVKRGSTNGTLYNQMTVLRTAETILGLQPLTMFDAAATPMSGVFSNTADVTPYTAAGR